MPNSTRTTLNLSIIDDAEVVSMVVNLLNQDNLSVPLQLLAKARYLLSVIHDEILHTAKDNIFDRGKISYFTSNLHTVLAQAQLALFEYDDIKELIEPLLYEVKQLYNRLYADDKLCLKDFKDIAKQTLEIHNCLEQICLLSLYRQVEGK